MLPHVILHNAVSVDGRIDGFTPDIELYYELASRWGEDATLVGCDTLLKACSEERGCEESEETFEPTEMETEDTRALLVVPDSRGRMRNWSFWRKQPYWKDVVVLCSRSTPKSYLDNLKENSIDYIVAGDEHVDMKTALEELNARYSIEVIRVDSGGTLNGILLRAGLVNEVSILIHPDLVGGMTLNSIFKAPDLNSLDDVIHLRLTHVEKLENEIVWLKYEV